MVHMPVILALGKLRQEVCSESEASPVHKVRPNANYKERREERREAHSTGASSLCLYVLGDREGVSFLFSPRSSQRPAHLPLPLPQWVEHSHATEHRSFPLVSAGAIFNLTRN